jgi:8-oxo-dGTP pyrophosphatase MutT (NUDIX family)
MPESASTAPNMTSQNLPNHPTQQFPASDFVESCGAIPFLLSKSHVYLVRYIKQNEWLLAKGRRDCGESRSEAAIREIQEETGLKCKLLPITMATRAPATHLANDVRDKARIYPDLTEPFMFTFRPLAPGNGVKLIFWFIAAIDETDLSTSEGEATFQVASFNYEEAVEKLTWDTDRDVLKQAVKLVEQNYPPS